MSTYVEGLGAVSGWQHTQSGPAYFHQGLVYTGGQWHQAQPAKGSLPTPEPTIMPCISCTSKGGKIVCSPCDAPGYRSLQGVPRSLGAAVPSGQIAQVLINAINACRSNWQAGSYWPTSTRSAATSAIEQFDKGGQNTIVGQAVVQFEQLPLSIQSVLSEQWSATYNSTPFQKEAQRWCATPSNGGCPPPSSLSGLTGQLVLWQNNNGMLLGWNADQIFVGWQYAVCLTPSYVARFGTGAAVPSGQLAQVLISALSSCSNWQAGMSYDPTAGRSYTSAWNQLESGTKRTAVGRAIIQFEQFPASVQSALSTQWSQIYNDPKFQQHMQNACAGQYNPAIGCPPPSTLAGLSAPCSVFQNSEGIGLYWPDCIGCVENQSPLPVFFPAVCLTPGYAKPVVPRGVPTIVPPQHPASPRFSPTTLMGLGQAPTDLASLAGAMMSAFAADSNGCGNVCVNGSAVNSAVHAFKVAWNQTGWGSDPVPAGASTLPGADAFASYGPLAHNGQYDQACANAAAATGITGVLGPCDTPCNAGPAPGPPVTTPAPTSYSPSGGGGRNYVPWILGGAAVLGLGIVGYAMYRKPVRTLKRA